MKMILASALSALFQSIRVRFRDGMMFAIFFCIIFILLPVSNLEMEGSFKRGRDVSDGPTTDVTISRRQGKTQSTVAEDMPLPCDLTEARSEKRPVNVNEVRPGDIDVVGAIGDGFTTATGADAENFYHLSREYRGLSWSIGGEGDWRKYLTLPNILKHLNPNLIGFSTDSDDSAFNAAGPGSTIKDIYYLAKTLVKRMRADGRVDMENDWKLITIYIGGNDFCKVFCVLGDEDFWRSHTEAREHLVTALDYLRDNLPRTIVNLVPPRDLSNYSVFEKTIPSCRSLHSIFCPCLFGQMNHHTSEENRFMMREWQRVHEELARDERYRKSDFLVVSQPFTKNFSIPVVEIRGRTMPDLTFFTQDCFHFSQKGHAAAANALWNNMLEPIGHKSESATEPFDRLLCPTPQHPYIFSYDNSPSDSIALKEFYLAQ